MAGLPHVHFERWGKQRRQTACSRAMDWPDDAVRLWLCEYSQGAGQLQDQFPPPAKRSAAVLSRGSEPHRGNERPPDPHPCTPTYRSDQEEGISLWAFRVVHVTSLARLETLARTGFEGIPASCPRDIASHRYVTSLAVLRDIASQGRRAESPVNPTGTEIQRNGETAPSSSAFRLF